MKKINLILLIVLAFLLIALNAYNKNRINSNQAVGKIIKVDNSKLVVAGKARIGGQDLEVKILNGPHKGEVVPAFNNLIGDFEFDEVYENNNKILLGIQEFRGELTGKTLSLYREGVISSLMALFIICLLLYARTTGLYALLSFIGSVLVIWRVLIPLLLKGYNPILITTLSLSLLTGLIVFSVAGFTKKGMAAFLGTMFGLISTLLVTIIFGYFFKLQGMTAPFSQALYFGSGLKLNMKDIFYSAILIGASGAAMDIAMDVAVSMSEVLENNKLLTREGIIKSGFNVGRSVIGTMTTTLLLAYSGSYLTLIMLFYQKGTGIAQILNMKIISAEIMRTVIGSIGLILVAPITAIIAGYIYCDQEKKLDQLKNYIDKF